MSQSPPDPLDHASPDAFATSTPDQLKPLPSDPAEPPRHAQTYNNPLAIGSLASGIVSVMLTFSCFCCWPFALVGGAAGLVAVVLGLIALRQIKAGEGTGRGLAIGGIISGILVLLLLMLVVVGFFILAQDQVFEDFEWLRGDALKLDVVPEEDLIRAPEIELIPVEPDIETGVDSLPEKPSPEPPADPQPKTPPAPTNSTPPTPGN